MKRAGTRGRDRGLDEVKRLQIGAFCLHHAFSPRATRRHDASSVIVTDRLHASILAFLMNKPHVYLDQFTRKLSATRAVSFHESIACKHETLKYAEARNLEQATRKALEFLKA